MIYLFRGRDTATAECEASAARLEAHGWQRCDRATHRWLWRRRDMVTLQRIHVEDWLARQNTPVKVA